MNPEYEGFMQFQYMTLQGEIRITSDFVYLLRLKNFREDVFKKFVNFIRKDKTIVVLSVTNESLYQNLMRIGFVSHYGTVQGLKKKYRRSLFKEQWH